MFLFCFVGCLLFSSRCLYPFGVTKVGLDVLSKGSFCVAVYLLLFLGFVCVLGDHLDY